MRWLKDAGVSSNLEEYLALPAFVLEEARLLMEAEAVGKQRAANQQQRAMEQIKRRG